jgi:fructose-1,6-bisphosphatase I
MEKSRIDLPIGVTLDRFIKSKESEYPSAVGAFSQLLRDIALAAKVVNRELNKAGLIDIMGNAGNYNAGGDEQKKLDILANTRFIRALSKGGEVCGIISEENESFIDLANDGKYIVALDPLDGSSNIDVNVSVGTIFSIYKRISAMNSPLTEADFLQKGRAQIAAGYILYGPSSMMVFTTGNGVNGFTYEPTLGEFVLSNANIQCNEDGTIYSVNEGISNSIVEEKVKQYIQFCKDMEYTGRYIGSLVADFHRNLLKGGIYLYPATNKYPNGKLRLMFESNALAFVIEQAGGLATDGNMDILDIVPKSIHYTTPLFIGSKNMVSSRLLNLQG